MATYGKSDVTQADIEGCEIIFITDKHIDLRCKNEEQAEKLEIYLSNNYWSAWIVELIDNSNEVILTKPEPVQRSHSIVDQLKEFHGIQVEAQHIDEIIKELIDKYGLSDGVNWDYFSQSAEFANHFAPDIRAYAGCKDEGGMGTYQDCSEDDLWREQEIYDAVRSEV